MNPRIVLTVVTGLVLIVTLAQANSPSPLEKSPLADNAALVYWQAFATMPTLNERQNRIVKEIVENHQPIGDEAEAIVASADGALREMYRGIQHTDCVWATALEDGPNALLSHLAEARKLARLACLRARLRFAEGNPTAAVDDLNATLILGRHVGSEGVLISLLVQYAIESLAMECAAENLPMLDAQARALLSDGIASLPNSRTMSDAMRVEKEALLEWFIKKLSEPEGRNAAFSLFGDQDNPNITALSQLSEAEVLAAAKQLRPVYDELIGLMVQPPQAVEKMTAQMAQRPELQGAPTHFGGLILPAAVATRRSEAVHEARWFLLKAGITVTTDGPDALKQEDMRDPFGEGPLAYEKNDRGFELTSALLDRKQRPVKLVFGPAAAE